MVIRGSILSFVKTSGWNPFGLKSLTSVISVERLTALKSSPLSSWRDVKISKNWKFSGELLLISEWAPAVCQTLHARMTCVNKIQEGHFLFQNWNLISFIIFLIIVYLQYEWWGKTRATLACYLSSWYQVQVKDLGLLLSAAAAAKSLQSCPTLCDPMDCSPPGSPIPGILQARTLEWVAISFSNAWKWKVKVKSLSHVQPSATPWTAAYQAPPSMGFSRQEYWVELPSPLLLSRTVLIWNPKKSRCFVVRECFFHNTKR